MKRTENLNLPIYDNPESDIFKVNDVNNAHETIDKQYKELKNIKETIESTNPSANLQGQINDISASLETKAYKYYLTPEDFGAKGDGITDDTESIKRALESNFNIKGSGKYLISSTIDIINKTNADIDFTGSYINYTGTANLFNFKNIVNTNLRFGKVKCDYGYFADWISENDRDFSQYVNIYFQTISSLSNQDCIKATINNNGWINEIRFYDGRFLSGENAIHIINNKQDMPIDHWNFYNIAFEGVTNGLKIETTGENKFCSTQGFSFYGLRVSESFEKIIVASGVVENFIIDTGSALSPGLFELTDKCNNWFIKAPFFNSDYTMISRVCNGELIFNDMQNKSLTSGARIKENVDLNSLTSIGEYSCRSNNVAGSLLNCPLNVAFKLTVKSNISTPILNSNYLSYIQEIESFDGLLKYSRTLSKDTPSNSWVFSEWLKIQGSKIGQVSSNSITSSSNTAYSNINVGRLTLTKGEYLLKGRVVQTGSLDMQIQLYTDNHDEAYSSMAVKGNSSFNTEATITSFVSLSKTENIVLNVQYPSVNSNKTVGTLVAMRIS